MSFYRVEYPAIFVIVSKYHLHPAPIFFDSILHHHKLVKIMQTINKVTNYSILTAPPHYLAVNGQRLKSCSIPGSKEK
jgi:hypothetical protein